MPMSEGAKHDLELFKFDSCPFCRRVLEVIDRLQVAVRVRDTMRESDANRELIERGGKRMVPCLFIDGRPMYESEDIARWLEANYG